MNKFYIFITIIFVANFSFVNAYTFTRNLDLGSSGQDVLELQKLLNQDPDTQIASFGAGSPNNETTYFGTLTKNALKKFQNKYAEEILKPLGLSFGTGYFGPATIKFINSLAFKNEEVSQNSEQKNNNIAKKPVIKSITPQEITGKTKITIIGENFSPNDNTLIITLEKKADYDKIKSTDSGTKIEFEFESSIQKTYNEKYKNLSKTTKERMREMFPVYPISISVLVDGKQSNIKGINFNLEI